MISRGPGSEGFGMCKLRTIRDSLGIGRFGNLLLAFVEIEGGVNLYLASQQLLQARLVVEGLVRLRLIVEQRLFQSLDVLAFEQRLFQSLDVLAFGLALPVQCSEGM